MIGNVSESLCIYAICMYHIHILKHIIQYRIDDEYLSAIAGRDRHADFCLFIWMRVFVKMTTRAEDSTTSVSESTHMQPN